MTRTSASKRAKPAVATKTAAKTKPAPLSSVRIGRGCSGLGLFATRKIPKGERIIEYIGVMLDDAAYAKSRSRYLFDVGGPGALDGSPRWNIARYINHSCAPNCEPFNRRRRVFIHAHRNIAEGEELSYDYGKDYFKEHIGDACRCVACQKK